jgi:hypothetical protein|tara:strand:- start:416 stop:712 length:297 start_codon:yes stop_codon:yes gene_type:complete
MSQKYRITSKYCWFENASFVVKMYFINNIPFTFDELPDGHLYDKDVTTEANENMSYDYEDLYKLSDYLISEQCHPCLFPMDLENPEDMPDEYREDLPS